STEEFHRLCIYIGCAYLLRLLMNVVVESQPNCLVTLRVELPADQVSKEWTNVTRDFQRQARIPGYRPGKAPRALVESRFAKDIKEELTSKLLRESLNEAIREKNLRVLSVSQVENVEIAEDRTMRYRATVVTAPEFELPDYSSISADLAKEEVSDENVDRWIDQMREPHASYVPVEGRPLAMGDYAVVTYTANLESKPLGEVIPDAPAQLQGRRNAWIVMDERSLLPGFSQSIVGMQINEERTISIELPADFSPANLAGRSLEYAVTLHAINTKVLPEWDDALAEKIEPGATVNQLREKMRARLESLAEANFQNSKRQAAVRFLLDRVDCELPAPVVAKEAGEILQDIVRDNQVRGVSDDEMRKHQDELIGAAQQGARDRVRGNFLLLRVAEREKLEVTEEDLTRRILELAARYEIAVPKLVKDLERRKGFGALREQILIGKALDLLAANVRVRASASQPATA
ncbi:MAG TPA: trigger factor, partial [Terrimicrobiaceae bacterium]|nr:trigger factor [Terrimicrobiaceae bacterium]